MIIDIIFIIACILFLVHYVVSAPPVDAYSNYDLTMYNCLDIALDTQEWYLMNGIETIIYVGCFNDTLCHAWLEDTKGNKIIGFALSYEYESVSTLQEWNQKWEQEVIK